MNSAGSGNDPNIRYDNSLGLLTRKFVDLLKDSEDGILDLNYAATQLEVQKRRIYDITNVLEGIGLIEKKSKNNVRWKGTGSTQAEETLSQSAEAQRLQKLRDEVLALRREEAQLDRSYEAAQSVLRQMSEDDHNRRLTYLTHHDIRSIPEFAQETLLAVKAPYGSTLEVPDPDEGMPPGQRRFEVQLSSKSGPIDVFLIQDPNAAAALASSSGEYNDQLAAVGQHAYNHYASSSGNAQHYAGFHGAEILKPFDLPLDSFAFEMKAEEGPADLYGLVEGPKMGGGVNSGLEAMYNVFS